MESAERERIREHLKRGRTMGEKLAASDDTPQQVFGLALNALDIADLPMVQNDTIQVALLLGIVSACSEWIITSAKRSDSLAELLSVELPESITVIVSEASLN